MPTKTYPAFVLTRPLGAVVGFSRPSDSLTALVLQGGGALGAYQGGAFEALADTARPPDWVAGISIGAINAALIAGNAPENRVQRLRDFWQRVTASVPSLGWTVADGPLRPWAQAWANDWAAAWGAAFGLPAFFLPRLGAALWPGSATAPASMTPSRCARRCSHWWTSTG